MSSCSAAREKLFKRATASKTFSWRKLMEELKETFLSDTRIVWMCSVGSRLVCRLEISFGESYKYI